MRTIRKRHRDAINAMQVCRRAFKLALLFGAAAFLVMVAHIILPEVTDSYVSYSELVSDIVLISTCLYLFFLLAAIIVALFMYFLFRKHNLSTRMFRLKDLSILLSVQFVVIALTAYVNYFAVATE